MIDATHLRIGNWVMFDGEPDLITEIWENLCGGRSFSRYTYDRVSPIPLTPEILEKSGFKKSSPDFTWDFDKLSVHLPGKSYPKGRTYFNAWCIKEGIPQSLHQLQNLYFSLTNQELQITL